MFNNTATFSSYSIDNVEKALAFYRDLLGLDATKTKEGISLKTSGSTIFLYPKEDHAPANFTVLNFKVEDIDIAVAALAEKGVTLERYDSMPQDEQGVFRGKASGNGPDIAWFKDPAGNILSVLAD